MEITLPLLSQKSAMESLWVDVSREEDFQSPARHEDVLKEREEKIRSGQEKFIDWDAAKKELRNRLS